jgi:hypothetical protein
MIEEAYDLSCSVIESPANLHVRFQFSRTIFAPDAVVAISRRLIELMALVAAAPGTQVKGLS